MLFVVFLYFLLPSFLSVTSFFLLVTNKYRF
jgi:hypothetical protein